MTAQLIVGLGNPGTQYQTTRHNVGFWFLDQYAETQQVSLRPDRHFNAEMGSYPFNEERIWLVKPMTFMNRSGQAIHSIAQFYKIPPTSILVVHDDLDFPPGAVRVKRGGGHGQHNGLRDTATQLSSSDFWRIRLGIGHPGHRDQVVGYVLGTPPPHEQHLIQQAIAAVITEMAAFLTGDVEKVTQRLHSRSSPS